MSQEVRQTCSQPEPEPAPSGIEKEAAPKVLQAVGLMPSMLEEFRVTPEVGKKKKARQTKSQSQAQSQGEGIKRKQRKKRLLQLNH